MYRRLARDDREGEVISLLIGYSITGQSQGHMIICPCDIEETSCCAFIAEGFVNGCTETGKLHVCHLLFEAHVEHPMLIDRRIFPGRGREEYIKGKNISD